MAILFALSLRRLLNAVACAAWAFLAAAFVSTSAWGLQVEEGETPAEGQVQPQENASPPAPPKPPGTAVPNQREVDLLLGALRRETAPMRARIKVLTGDERYALVSDYYGKIAALQEANRRSPASAKVAVIATMDLFFDLDELEHANQTIRTIPEELFTKEELDVLWKKVQTQAAEAVKFATVIEILIRRMNRYDLPIAQANREMEAYEDERLRISDPMGAYSLLSERLFWDLPISYIEKRYRKFLAIAIREGNCHLTITLAGKLQLDSRETIAEQVKAMREMLRQTPVMIGDPEFGQIVLGLAFDSLNDWTDEKRIDKAAYLVPTVRKAVEAIKDRVNQNRHYAALADDLAAGLALLEADIAALKKLKLRDDPALHEALGRSFLARDRYAAGMYHISHSNHPFAAAAKKYIAADGATTTELTQEFTNRAFELDDSPENIPFQRFVISFAMGRLQVCAGAEFNAWEKYVVDRLDMWNDFSNRFPGLTRYWIVRAPHNRRPPAPETVEEIADILSRDALLVLNFNVSVGKWQEKFRNTRFGSTFRDQCGSGTHAFSHGRTFLYSSGFRRGSIYVNGGYLALPRFRERLLEKGEALSISVWHRGWFDRMIFDCGRHPGSSVSLATNWFSIADDHGGATVRWPYPQEDHEWQHLAAIWDGENMIVYINGEQVASGKTKKMRLTPEIIPDNIAVLATRSAEPGHFFVGGMDEFALFSRPLSHDEVKKLYEFGLQGGTFPTPTGAAVPKELEPAE